MTTWKWTFDPNAVDAARADAAIAEALGQGLGEWNPAPPSDFHSSRSQVQRWMADGKVTLAGKTLTPKDKPKPGELIVLAYEARRPLDLSPIDLPIDILYQDHDIVVVNKPQGMSVHPSDTDKDPTLVHALLHHIRDLSGVGGELRPGIVHRIDKNTSGILVVSKNDRAHHALAELFASHDIERRYWALCYGKSKRPQGEWKRVKTFLSRNPQDRVKMMVSAQGRQAITDYTYIEDFEVPITLIEARLHTGRTHQVRVHLTAEGHSLLGDPLYGAPSKENTKWKTLPIGIRKIIDSLPGQMLHARVLGFKHPSTGKPMRFEVDPPAAFADLLHALRSVPSQLRTP